MIKSCQKFRWNLEEYNYYNRGELVTILIYFKDHVEQLATLLPHILKQDYNNIQIKILDDCSKVKYELEKVIKDIKMINEISDEVEKFNIEIVGLDNQSYFINEVINVNINYLLNGKEFSDNNFYRNRNLKIKIIDVSNGVVEKEFFLNKAENNYKGELYFNKLGNYIINIYDSEKEIFSKAIKLKRKIKKTEIILAIIILIVLMLSQKMKLKGKLKFSINSGNNEEISISKSFVFAASYLLKKYKSKDKIDKNFKVQLRKIKFRYLDKESMALVNNTGLEIIYINGSKMNKKRGLVNKGDKIEIKNGAYYASIEFLKK